MPHGYQRPAKQFSPEEIRARAAAFHEVYYYNRLWEQAHWFGVPTWKCPLDLWVVQEILAETKPDVIVECGTALGGSAMYFASICRLAGYGRIISIDVKDPVGLPSDPLVEYVQGSSTDPETLERVRARITPNERVMLVLDSLHSEAHVREELELWGGLVSPGCYCVVEDTNINGHPVYTDYEPDAGPGAYEAVEGYLATTDRFVRDPGREKLLLTFNPGGFLRCVAESALIVGTLEGAAPGASKQATDADKAATKERLRAEMDAAKRLAVERYEAIRSLSASLAEQLAVTQTVRQAESAARQAEAAARQGEAAARQAETQARADEAHARQIEEAARRAANDATARVIWLTRQVESADLRYAAMRRDHEQTLASAMDQVRELSRSRAVLAEMLDARGTRLKATMLERDALLAQQLASQAQIRDLNALLNMAKANAARLEGELVDASRVNNELERRLRDTEIDVETLLVRVQHLEQLEQARRQHPEAPARRSGIWSRNARHQPAAKG